MPKKLFRATEVREEEESIGLAGGAAAPTPRPVGLWQFRFDGSHIRVFGL